MQPRNTLSRRDFLRVSAGVTGVALLAACAPSAAPSGGEAAAPGAERVEITFAGWGATRRQSCHHAV